jgi:branched-chain amino acid transport system substrate-binding protein
MNKTNKIILWIIAVVIIVALIWLGYSEKQPVVEGETIKIGFVGALSGDAASFGIEEKNSAVLAVKEINEKGGINGKLIEVIFEDGKCNGKDAITAAQKLVNVDNVKIILGGSCSSETFAMIPFTEENKIILLNSFSLSPEITKNNEYVFRNVPSDEIPAKELAKLAILKGHENIAVIYEQNDYPVAFKEDFVNEFEKNGGQIVLEENYLSNQSDFKTIITKIKDKNPEAILISSLALNNFEILIKQLNQLGIDKQIYGNTVLGVPDLLERIGQYLEGSYFIEPANLDDSDERVNKFLNDYENEFGKKLDVAPFWAVARYDSVYILKQALEEVGFDNDKIKDYLYNLENFDGLIGSYRFNEEGDVVGIEFKYKMIKDKKPVIVDLENI